MIIASTDPAYWRSLGWTVEECTRRMRNCVEAIPEFRAMPAHSRYTFRLYREQNGCDLESARKYVDTCTRY